MIITRICPLTGELKEKDLPVTEEQMKLFSQPQRPLIQKIFPNLSPGDREFILTGITDDVWDDTFKQV